MDDHNFIAVAHVDDVPQGTIKAITVAGRSILLCHEDRLYAVENLCSHAQQPLECGRLKYGWISCPTHGARFDLETGEAISGPATEPIAVFPLRVVGDVIEIAA